KDTFELNQRHSCRDFDLAGLIQRVPGVSGRLQGYAGYAFFDLGKSQPAHREARFDPSLPFLFPAEDGIRDFHVTGVQTCALPISTCSCAPAPSTSSSSTPWRPSCRALRSRARWVTPTSVFRLDSCRRLCASSPAVSAP